MRKIFLMATFLLVMLTATAFAADNEVYEYTSETYGFKITCPAKPIVVVNPFEDPNQKGELLVFANDGIKIIYGFQILLDAFETTAVPDFNKADKKILDQYVEEMRVDNAYEYVGLQEVSKKNKGVLAITARRIELRDENGEVAGELVADQQSAFTFFRTSSGRCISIQLITDDFTQDNLDDYKKSVSTFRDASDKPDKKSKK